ncbi:MAG TPA: ParA family protein [Beijerinckiaceae bacterium]|jgi:chromosome partitioning protein
MNVIVFASRKGGSGKSTLTAHLAAQAARPSRACLLVDADPQGSLSLWHGLRRSESPALKRAPRGVEEAVRAAKREGYEWVFVDTPPNKSGVVAEAIRLATLVVIPARPSVFDVAAVADTIELCRELKKPYAVVINAAPAKRNDAEAAIVADARAGLTAIKVPVWSGQITHRSDFCFALGAGAGAKEFDPGSLAAAEMANLWGAIEKSVKAINGAYETARAMHRAA